MAWQASPTHSAASRPATTNLGSSATIGDPVTLARNPKDQERLIELVRLALHELDAGRAVDATALCRDDPHLALPLAEVLGLSDQLPNLQRAARDEDPLAGALLAGRYQLANCLGRGAMGVVYRAEDLELRRPVAVKILDVRLFRDPDAEQRFQREAEALAALQHGHVVAVFDRGRTPEGIHYLVMELLEGATLAAVLAEARDEATALGAAAAAAGGPPAESHWPRLAARWARDLAEGLAAAHARGLVHRDVKPSNVFVARGGRPVLLDFGIAARTSDERLTATQTTLGTPWYMAPEQVRAGGLTVAAPALDVYGLGATLYHLLAFRAPYEGEAAAVLAALATRDPVPLAEARRGLPRDLAAIVETCLERDPKRRYPTAAALAQDLDAFLAHRPVTARPLGAFGRRLRTWRRAPARPLAVAALLLAVFVTAVAWPLWARERARERAQAKAELMATLPSLIAIEGYPEQRLLGELQNEHQTDLALLDRILDLDPSDLPVRLWRALLHLDLGERAVASADFAVIASDGDSAYLRALAGRYVAAAAAAPTGDTAPAISRDGLPEPDTDAACYVAGVHELRASNVPGFVDRADALLLRAAPSYLPARDFRLFSLAARAEGAERGSPAQRALTKQLYDDTIALEALYGGKTARTCQMRGVALLLDQRYRDSVPEFEQALALRPDRHGPHHNLGVAFLNLNELDRSAEHLREAMRLRPFAWNTRHTLARLERNRRHYAAARDLAANLPKTGTRGEAWQQPELVASIEFAEGAELLVGDPERGAACLRKAVVAYDEALAVRASQRTQQRRDMATALLAGQRAAVGTFAPVLLLDAQNPYMLANLAFLLPAEGLDKAQTAWVAAVLRQVAIDQAGGDEVLKQRLEGEIETGLKQYR